MNRNDRDFEFKQGTCHCYLDMFFIGEHDDHVSVFSVHSSIKVSWYGSKLVYESFFLKMGQLRPLFAYIVLFKHKFYGKKLYASAGFALGSSK